MSGAMDKYIAENAVCKEIIPFTRKYFIFFYKMVAASFF